MSFCSPRVHLRGDHDDLKDLRQARDHPRAREPHRVDELQAQRLGEGEVLAQELPHLPTADALLPQKAAQLHREVPDAARGHHEG